MMKKKPSPRRSKKKKNLPLILLFAALFLVISALLLLRLSGIGAAPGSDSFKRVLNSTELMQDAKLVKQDLKDIASEMKEGDITAMEFSRRKLDTDVATLKEYLSRPIWSLAEHVPIVGQDVKTAKALVEVSESFSSELFNPWVDLQKTAPFTELKTEEGIDYDLLPAYSAFLGEKLPQIRSMLERLSKLNLRLVDDDGKISSLIQAAAPLVEIADDHYEELIRPGLAFVAEHHPNNLKTEHGYDLELLGLYYDFFREHLPVIKSMLNELESADLSLIDKDGKYRRYLDTAVPLVDLADRYGKDLLDPGFELLAAYPISELKTDDGINFKALGVWSDFLEGKGDKIGKMLEELQKIDLSAVDKEGKLSSLLGLGRQLLEIGIPANEQLLRPALKLIEERPLSSIKVDGGFDVTVLLAYLDFAESKLGEVDALCEALRGVDASALDPESKITKYLEKFFKLQTLMTEYKEYIPAARVILGDGKTDRFYIFPAQNSAEIRASGGFPGDVGSIEIRDGVLRIGPFISVYSAFTPYTSGKAKVTQQEINLFTERMYAPRDVDFCPDFERVGQIWAYAYEDARHVKVDGIISSTPTVVQKLLAAAEAEVELSNGLVLNGENATKILQRDLYFMYKSAGKIVYSDDDMTDKLFSETISKTLEAVTSDLSPSRVLDYVGVWKDCIEERIIMLWMADPEEEDVLRQIGWTGSMNSDPNNPKLGLFFSSEQSGKMGYFFDMLPEIGEPVVNDDGSRTYNVTVLLNNVVTKEEQRIGGTWILGRNYVGSIVGDLTVCAPAGGRIDSISINIARGFRQETWCGLDTRYIQWLIIERNVPYTVRITVTTAPGVDAPLGILATPTLTDYR